MFSDSWNITATKAVSWITFLYSTNCWQTFALLFWVKYNLICSF